MIVFVVATGHSYTFKALGEIGGAPPFEVTTYYRLFGSKHLPRATYVFTDVDRLSAWELRLAGELFRALVERQRRRFPDRSRKEARAHLAGQTCGRPGGPHRYSSGI